MQEYATNAESMLNPVQVTLRGIKADGEQFTHNVYFDYEQRRQEEKPISALWNIKVGKRMYKRKISLSYAYAIAESLQDEVTGIQIRQYVDAKEARRSVEAG